MVDDEQRRVPDVRVDRVAEDDQLDDRRDEDDPLHARVPEDLPQLLDDHPQHAGPVDAHHATSLRNTRVASPSPRTANATMNTDWIHSTDGPTPLSMIPRATTT